MNRAGFKWNVNEILSLQREFELLGWSIDQIALKHKRTPNAIMYKLDQEGFADYNVLYSNYHDLNSRIQQFKKPTNLQLNYDYDTEIDDSDVDDDKNDEDYVDSQDSEYSEEEEEEDDYKQDVIDNLSQRVYNLETVVYEIQLMLNQMKSDKSNNTSKQSLSKSVF
jgi:hypothetical protein